MAILRGYGDDMATMSQKISHGKTASKQARVWGGTQLWSFMRLAIPAHAHTLLKQEGLQLAETGFRDLHDWLKQTSKSMGLINVFFRDWIKIIKPLSLYWEDHLFFTTKSIDKLCTSHRTIQTLEKGQLTRRRSPASARCRWGAESPAEVKTLPRTHRKCYSTHGK